MAISLVCGRRVQLAQASKLTDRTQGRGSYNLAYYGKFGMEAPFNGVCADWG